MIIGLNLLLSTLAFSVLSAWYFWPWLKLQSKETALQVLIWPHVFRHIGMMFLAMGAVKTTLPEVFSVPAAYGDLIAAILAFVTLIAIRHKSISSLAFIWVFNIWGTVDLLYAITIGTINQADQSMGATFWIPALIVPALLVSHVLIFLLLTKKTQTKF